MDVGAAGGVPPPWERAKARLRVVGFEPDPRSIDRLRKNPEGVDSIYLNTGLYKEKGAIDLYLTRDNRKSSIIPPNDEFLKKFVSLERTEIVETKKITVDTLDNQLRENGVKEIDFIKIDAQGSELFILQGAKETLQKLVFGLEVEVSFAKRYKNQPLFGEVDNYLRNFGYELIDIKPYYLKRLRGHNCGGWKGQAIIGKTLYFKSTEKFTELLSGYRDPEEHKSKILKAMTIALLYGYVDIALEIFEETKTALTEAEKKLINSAIKRICAPRIKERLPGGRTIARLILKFMKIFESENSKKIRKATLLGNFDEI